MRRMRRQRRFHLCFPALEDPHSHAFASAQLPQGSLAPLLLLPPSSSSSSCPWRPSEKKNQKCDTTQTNYFCVEIGVKSTRQPNDLFSIFFFLVLFFARSHTLVLQLRILIEVRYRAPRSRHELTDSRTLDLSQCSVTRFALWFSRREKKEERNAQEQMLVGWRLRDCLP